MRNYQGAVLFVDMLGFGALTQGEITLTPDELSPWKADKDRDFSHQHLAARIILSFRSQLVATKKQHPHVKVAQLSDCAFIWSSELKQVVDAGRDLMHGALRAGLLCRGGLAFGDIYEPDKVNRLLGEFIVGDAVTKAANHEKAGKGMRLFTDEATTFRIRHDFPDEEFFKSFNALNGDAVDEWRWYFPISCIDGQASTQQARAELRQMALCYATLKHSPKLAWSAKTPVGRRQIACSLFAIITAMEDVTRNTGYFLKSIGELERQLGPRSEKAHEAAYKKIYAELLVGMRMATKRDAV